MMVLTILGAAVAILAGATLPGYAYGYLRGSRQHIAEHAQAEWVHELTAAPDLLAIEAAIEAEQIPVYPADVDAEYGVDEATMLRVLALVRAESPLTAALADTDYWAPIAASMGPMPVEPELELVGAG